MSTPNMEDVARAAGVHRTTVSRALKNDPRLAADTATAVRKIAEEMGYRTNPLIAALMSQRRRRGGATEVGTIAYIDTVSERLAHPVYRAFREGAREWAEKLGYTFNSFPIDRSMTPKRVSQILRARGIRGVCISPLRSARGHLNLDWDFFVSAAIGYTLIRPMLHRAVAHAFHGILLAMRELRRLGYRRIGLCLDSRVSRRVDENWVAGFLLFQRNNPRGHFPILVERGITTTAFSSWFARERPDVVISDSYGFEDTIVRVGLRAPADVGFVTLARSAEAPHQAGIDQHLEMIGAAAVDLIIGQLHRNERGVPAFPKTTMIEGTWSRGGTIRESQIPRR